MSMRGRNPFEEIEQFFERMSQQFEESAEWPTAMGGTTPVDVLDHGEEYEVTVDLPGFEKEDVEVILTDDTLQVSASHETEAEETDSDYVRRERRSESVNRSVSLPDSVDQEAVDATLSNGVLTITLEKQVSGDDARTIDIE